MSDTLQIMQLVDQMGRGRSLDDVCRLVIASRAVGHTLDAASILVCNDDGVLQERGRHLVPGSPADFSQLELTFPTPLALALARPGSSTFPIDASNVLHPDISFPLHASGFAGVWMLPLSLSHEPFALFLGFSQSLTKLPTLSRHHEELFSSALKLAIRHHSWRQGATTHPPRLAS
jgi:hypothetical protein